MFNKILRLRRLRGDMRAAQRGPQAMGKRMGQRGLIRLVRQLFR